MNRQFSAPSPNHSRVTDFTYVAPWGGFVYVAFAIDLYSRMIVGWSISAVKDTPFVEVCLAMALWRRDHAGHPVERGLIHHSDAGSQSTSIKFIETVALEGLVDSIGTVGDAYDNAAAETVMGMYKNEAIAKHSPFNTGPLKPSPMLNDSLSTGWIGTTTVGSTTRWGYSSPSEYESNYYAVTNGPLSDDAANKTAA